MAYLARSRRSPSVGDLSAVEPNRIAGGSEHYDIIDTLAHGSTADLLLAVRRGAMGVDSLVVLKRLRTSPADDKHDTDTFLQEARVSVRLRHANIVHTFGVGEDYGAPFLAMEYLEGESLRDVLRESATRDMRLKPSLAIHVACEALKGLHYAHTLRDYEGNPLSFVHRDVSPHNIFVGYDGTVKLIDFGIAKTTLAVDKTAEGIIKGKVAYLSPEQTLGHNLDPRSDIFSLGITLWEMLSMQRLMIGNSAFDTMLRILNAESPRLSEVTSGVAPALEEAVARSLARDKSHRFTTADEMRAALRDPRCLETSRASTEDLAEAMDFLFRDAKAQKQAAIHAKMTDLAQKGARTSVPGPPLRVMREHVQTPPPTDVSMRFVGPRDSAAPAAEESGERLSMRRGGKQTTGQTAQLSGVTGMQLRATVPANEGETTVRPKSIGEVAVVRAASLAKSAKSASSAPPPPSGVRVSPATVTGMTKTTPLLAGAPGSESVTRWLKLPKRSWLVVNLLVLAALAAVLAYGPTRARVTSASFWRTTGATMVTTADRLARDLMGR